jgi:hypothetical protein
MHSFPLSFAARPLSEALNRRKVAALFVVLATIALIPVWTHPLPPLSDYVNHLARMHAIATIDSDPDLARFYAVDWQIIPNLMMDLVVPVLHRVMNVYLAGQMFIIATFLLIVGGTLALNRALFGGWSATPLAAFPLLYNGVLLIGVMNYLFGVGLALWALAGWVALRQCAWPLRFVLSAFAVVLLFFCHLFSLGVYGVGLLAFEALLLWAERRILNARRIAVFVAAGLPFLLVAPLLLNSPTWQLVGSTVWSPTGKVDGILYAISVYYEHVALALTGLVILAAVWAVRRRALRVHPLALSLLAIGGAIYLAMPRVLFASYLADQRLPIALAFLLLACIQVRLQHESLRRAFAMLLALLTIIRITEVQVVWNQLSTGVEAIRDSARLIDRGARVLVAYADPASGSDARDFGLVHAACLAMIERSALVSTSFVVEGKHILRVRPGFENLVDIYDGTPPSIHQLLLAKETDDTAEPNYWDNWPAKFDFLYVLFTERGDANPEPDRLLLVDEGRRFQLYRILRDTPPQNR